MTTKRLYEAGALVESKTDRGTWPIRIITEGKGSSGIYSRELLENYKDVFSSRAMFGNHPKDPSKPWERSPFEIKAKLGPKIEYREVDGVAGLYGEAIVNDEVDKWLSEFHDVIGVSIFASGEGREDENGDWIVESFDPVDNYTSVDFVVAPGRGGGVEARVLEAFHAIETSATAEPGSAPAASRTEKKENLLDPKDFEERMARIEESLAALLPAVTALVESLKPAEKPDVDVAAAAVEADRKATEAGIPVELRTAIVEAAKSGGDVEAALTESKRVVESVKAGIIAEANQDGRFGGSTETHDFRVAGLKVS